MPKHRSITTQYLQYLALRSVAGLVQCFDANQNLHTAAGIGSLFYRLNPERRRRAEENIALSFPQWSPQRVAEVAERSMQHMFQVFMVESIMTNRLITPSSRPRHVQVGNLGPVLDRIISAEPAILITGHCGNWEMLGQALAVLGFPSTALARPIDNRFIDRWLRRIRQSRGMQILTKWGATPVIEQILSRGGRIGFLADQNAGPKGIFAPFFGRLASSYKSIGLLAMRYGVPISGGCAIRRHGRFEYEMFCTDYIFPRDWADQPDPLFYITARCNRAIERMITSAPEQYLWLHRRWKSRPPHEAQGRPIPRRLVEKLRSLPWLTDDDIQLICDRSNRAAAESRAGRGRPAPASVSSS